MQTPKITKFFTVPLYLTNRQLNPPFTHRESIQQHPVSSIFQKKSPSICSCFSLLGLSLSISNQSVKHSHITSYRPSSSPSVSPVSQFDDAMASLPNSTSHTSTTPAPSTSQTKKREKRSPVAPAYSLPRPPSQSTTS